MDTLTSEERSRRMAMVRGKDTKPELVVRRMIHGLGYRYRLHVSGLPGRPDLVFGSRKKVIFVHGCFWHRHAGCYRTRTPKSRVDFWQAKFQENVARDRRNKVWLTRQGWKYLIVWECETENSERVKKKVVKFLGERHDIN